MACQAQTPGHLCSLAWLQPLSIRFFKQAYNFWRTPSKSILHDSKMSEDVVCTSTLPDLPPEVVRVILQHLLHSDRHDFLSGLRISSLWADIGQPLLWKDIVITPSNLNVFAQAIELCPELAEYIQSLTIRTTHTKLSFNDGSWKIMLKLLESMSNLRTFSIFLNDKYLHVHYYVLNDLLRALPDTITSLEVDVGSGGVVPIRKGQHNCDTLRGLLPQLQHLRINGGVWCHHLFEGLDKTCGNLQSVTINNSRQRYGVTCQYIPCGQFRSDVIGESIAISARKAFIAGLMPALQSFDVVVRVFHSQKTHDTVQGMSLNHRDMSNPFATLEVKDVLQNRTTSFPISSIVSGTTSRDMIRYFGGKDGSATCEGLSSSNDVSSFMEGTDRTWIETTDGARFPASFRNSTRARAGHYEWATPLKLEEPPKSYKEKKVLANSNLWYWEEQSGRKLLHPRVHEGLERGPALTRETCSEESNPDLVANAPRPGAEVGW